MASYDYRIRIESKHPLGGHREVSEPGGSTVSWTHATATAWAHEKGAQNAMGGDAIVIERSSRRGSRSVLGTWLPHRRYVVGDDGIVRRTDR